MRPRCFRADGYHSETYSVAAAVSAALSKGLRAAGTAVTTQKRDVDRRCDPVSAHVRPGVLSSGRNDGFCAVVRQRADPAAGESAAVALAGSGILFERQGA